MAKRNRYELPDWFDASDSKAFRDYVDEHSFRSFMKAMRTDHAALRKECEEAGVPIENVSHYWYKSQDFSIFSKMPIGHDSEKAIEWLNEQLANIKKVNPAKVKGSGTIVVGMSDFHFGANVKAFLRTPAFNADIVISRIKAAVKRINAIGAKQVHLFLAGDFIESFTGVNHDNSWKELSMWGANAFIFTCEVMKELVLSKINNLAAVHMVAGNHDRVSIKSTLDSEGDFAAQLAYHLGQVTDIPVNFDYLVLNPIIDGVQYILMHGHQGLSKNEIYKILFEYGHQGMYNVITEGHLHSRIVKKAQSAKHFKVMDEVVVSMDSGQFRKITLPSMFTGNTYSQQNGWTSSAGFAWMQRYEGGIDHHDMQA